MKTTLLVSDKAVPSLPIHFPLKYTQEKLAAIRQGAQNLLPGAQGFTRHLGTPPGSEMKPCLPGLASFPPQTRTPVIQRGAMVGFECVLTKVFADRTIHLFIITGLATFQDLKGKKNTTKKNKTFCISASRGVRDRLVIV